MTDDEVKILRSLQQMRPAAPTKREKGIWSKIKESLGA